jgi:hypothetical protein
VEGILAKIQPERKPEPLPQMQRYEPPRAGDTVNKRATIKARQAEN